MTSQKLGSNGSYIGNKRFEQDAHHDSNRDHTLTRSSIQDSVSALRRDTAMHQKNNFFGSKRALL